MTGRINLNGVRMRTFASGCDSAVDVATVFEFEQKGDVFSARYRGGRILDGYLIGTMAEDCTLMFRYVQIDHEGHLDQGVSTGAVTRLEDGRLRLLENFCWLTREGSGQNVFEETGCGS